MLEQRFVAAGRLRGSLPFDLPYTLVIAAGPADENALALTADRGPAIVAAVGPARIPWRGERRNHPVPAALRVAPWRFAPHGPSFQRAIERRLEMLVPFGRTGLSGGRHRLATSGRFGRARRRAVRIRRARGAAFDPHANPRRALAAKAQPAGRAAGDVDDPASDEGPAVVDGQRYRAAVLQVRNMHPGAERQRLVRRGQGVHIVMLTACSAPAMETRSVPRGESDLVVVRVILGVIPNAVDLIWLAPAARDL